MQFGWVLKAFPQYPILAAKVSKEDCKNKLIACPHCRQLVYKVETQSGRHYLSHFPRAGRMDCELRVLRIGLNHYRGKAHVVTPSEHDLDAHLAEFENIMLTDCVNSQIVKQVINRMRARRSFCYIITDNREPFREYLRATAENVVERDLFASVTRVYQFLTAANSTRALIFAVCWGCISVSVNCEADDYEDGWFKENNDYEALIEFSDSKLKKHLIDRLTKDRSPDREQWQHVIRQLATAVGQASLDFVLQVINVTVDD